VGPVTTETTARNFLPEEHTDFTILVVGWWFLALTVVALILLVLIALRWRGRRAGQ
jgi:cell division protein FtsW (lipid II flippase)